MTLRVEHLSVSLHGSLVVDDVSFTVLPGERFGVIGASGSGKTVLALALTGLLPEGATVTGVVDLNGTNLLELSDSERAAVRGDHIGMVFQEPKSALNPLLTLGKQITEALDIHYRLSKEQRREAANQLSARVGLTDAERLLDSYPHQVSGGQRQRVAIAAAIAAEPELLIADEPTTALDVTVQQGILELFDSLSRTEKMGLIFITHDIAVLSQIAQTMIVLDAGRVVEQGAVASVLAHPEHPASQALIHAAKVAAWREGGDAQ